MTGEGALQTIQEQNDGMDTEDEEEDEFSGSGELFCEAVLRCDLYLT